MQVVFVHGLESFVHGLESFVEIVMSKLIQTSDAGMHEQWTKMIHLSLFVLFVCVVCLFVCVVCCWCCCYCVLTF